MIMPEDQALGDVLPTGPKGGADPLAARLQGFKAGPLLGGVHAHTLCRVMIHRDTNGHLPFLTRARRRHIRPPHRMDLCGDARPIMGLRFMRVPLPRGGQQLVGPH